MVRLNLILALALVAYLAFAEAGMRAPRSPQFGQASASATAFGGNGFQRPVFGGRKPGFGGGNFGPGPSGFGGRGPQFGSLNRPGQGTTINIAKSVSINTGGSSLSQASASSRG